MNTGQESPEHTTRCSSSIIVATDFLGCDAAYLVTSDTADFAHVLGTVVYGVKVRTPKSFLLEMGIVE